MELNNVKTEEFKSTGLSLIQQSGEILTLVRYPFRGGDKDYFLIDSDQGFKEFLDNRKPKDSVTIFKTFDFLKEGLVTQDFIDETLTQLNSIKSTDWLLIFLGQEKQKTNNWAYAGTEIELKEMLHDNLGHYVKILDEPEWLDENKVIHGYEPDEDGQIRPGAY
jgi:hypothetical protein